MYWRRRWVLISSALRHQTVQVTWHDDFTHLDVHFGPIRLGTIDTEHLERGLRIARRRRTSAGDGVGDVLALNSSGMIVVAQQRALRRFLRQLTCSQALLLAGERRWGPGL
jgi:hypothetical protein